MKQVDEDATDAAPPDISCEWCTTPYRPLGRCDLCKKWYCPKCMDTHPCDHEDFERIG